MRSVPFDSNSRNIIQLCPESRDIWIRMKEYNHEGWGWKERVLAWALVKGDDDFTWIEPVTQCDLNDIDAIGYLQNEWEIIDHTRDLEEKERLG